MAPFWGTCFRTNRMPNAVKTGEVNTGKKLPEKAEKKNANSDWPPMDRRIGKKKCQLCVFQADLRLCSWLGFGGAAWELLLHSLKGTQQRTKVWGVWNDSMLNWGVAGIAKCSNIEKCMRIRCPEILETVSMVCFLYQNMLFGKKNSVAPSFKRLSSGCLFPLWKAPIAWKSSGKWNAKKNICHQQLGIGIVDWKFKPQA